MKIIVTGGNGYVGRALCRLAYDEHDILCLDNLRFGHSRFESKELSSFEFVEGDIRDKNTIEAVYSKFQPDAIIHLAAIHFIPECENNPGEAVSINVEGTATLLDLCPPKTRFILASTAAVYAPEDAAHNENTSVIGPMDVYGWTKLHAEQYLRYYTEKRNLQTIIARLFNVIGPGETNPHVLPEIVAQLKSGRNNIQLGNMSPKRDYIDVDDAASAFLSLATNSTLTPGEPAIVNIGTQQQYSVSQLVEMLREVTGIDIQVDQDPARVRKSDRPFLMADNTQIRSLFGWSPKLEIKTALEKMWQNPDLPDSVVKQYQ